MPRRASFFHAGGGIPTSASVVELDPLYMMHASAYPPLGSTTTVHGHKLSVPFGGHTRLSAANLKRMSVPSSAAANAAAAHHETRKASSSSKPLAESESYEGPNYFLSRVLPAIRSEHSTQTTVLPYDQRQPPSLASNTNPHQYHTKTASYQQQQSKTLIIPSEEERRQSSPPPKRSTQAAAAGEISEEQVGAGSDQMKRRQTLVNLETAKYRYLAAEMAHKRVLERSADIGEAVSKRKSGGTDSKKSSTGKKKQHKSKGAPTPAKPTASQPPSNGRVPTSNKGVVPQDTREPSPPQLRPSPVVQQPASNVRGFEPSKVVPLLIARSLVSQSDGGRLLAVPEEAGHEGSKPESSPPFTVQSSPPVRRRNKATGPVSSELSTPSSPASKLFPTQTTEGDDPESSSGVPDAFESVLEEERLPSSAVLEKGAGLPRGEESSIADTSSSDQQPKIHRK